MKITINAMPYLDYAFIFVNFAYCQINRYSTDMKRNANISLAILMFIGLATATNATVRKNNFSINCPYTTTAYPNAGTTNHYAAKATTTEQKARRDSLVRSIGVYRFVTDGDTKFNLFSLFSNLSASGTEYKEFHGYTAWFANSYSSTETGVDETSFYRYVGTSESRTGGGAGYKGHYNYAIANDEYGNLMIGQNSQEVSTYFPDKLYIAITQNYGSGKEVSGARSTANNCKIFSNKAVQVWGNDEDTYYVRHWPAGLSDGRVHIIHGQGDMQYNSDKYSYTYYHTSSPAAANYRGYAWMCPATMTSYIFRVGMGWSDTEQDNIGYSFAGTKYIHLPSGVRPLSTSNCNSCIGYGPTSGRVLVHDFGNHKLYVVKYSESNTLSTHPANNNPNLTRNGVTNTYPSTIEADGYVELTDSSNDRFAWGTPIAFSIQGHCFLITAAGSVDSDGDAPANYSLYEINEDDSGNITLTKLINNKKPIDGYLDNTALKGPSFAWVRSDDMYGRVWGVSHKNGYFGFNIRAVPIDPQPCTVIRSYIQNGTSTPTRMRRITCNPPEGGYAIGYKLYYSTSNTNDTTAMTNITKQVYWQSRRVCYDTNATRLNQTGYYCAVATYECDKIARTRAEIESINACANISQTLNGAAYTNTASYIVPKAFNYYNAAGNALYDYSFSTNTAYRSGSPESGTTNTQTKFNVTLNGTTTSNTTVTSGTGISGTLTSMTVQPVYSIGGYALAKSGKTGYTRSDYHYVDSSTDYWYSYTADQTWDYYGTSRAVTSSSSTPTAESINPIAYDCPVVAQPSFTQSLQTTSAEVVRMDMPISWTAPTAATAKGASISSYEVIVKDSSNNVVFSTTTTSNSATVNDVQIGQQYTATIRTNYNYGGTAGHYSAYQTLTLTPNYEASAPNVYVQVYKNASGEVAVWDSELGWTNITAPVYRVEVNLAEPTGSHQPVSYYQLLVDKGDGNGFHAFSTTELRYFAAGSGNITPAQLTSKVTVPSSGAERTFYFYWDPYNLSHFPDTKGTENSTNSVVSLFSPKTVYPSPSSDSPENWTVRLVAVYGANNAKVLKTAYADDIQVNPDITSVDSTVANDVKDVIYYNLNGIRLPEPPASGVYVQVTLLNDGKVVTRKIVAK